MASHEEGELRREMHVSGATCWALGFADQRLEAHGQLTEAARQTLRSITWAFACSPGPAEEVALKAQEMVLADLWANAGKDREGRQIRDSAMGMLEKRALLFADGREQ